MISTLVGIYYGPFPSESINRQERRDINKNYRVAAGIDFAIFLTALVVGILCLSNVIHVPKSVSVFTIATGGIGLLLLAMKRIPPTTKFK